MTGFLTAKSPLVLVFVDLFNPLHRVDFRNWLVRAQANDSWKAQSVAAFMAIGAHDIVESYFKNDGRFNNAAKALVFYGVFQKVLGHVRDFDVGESGIGFADIQELFAT